MLSVFVRGVIFRQAHKRGAGRRGVSKDRGPWVFRREFANRRTGASGPWARVCFARRYRESENRVSGFSRAVERCRRGYSRPQTSQGRIRQVVISVGGARPACPPIREKAKCPALPAPQLTEGLFAGLKVRASTEFN